MNRAAVSCPNNAWHWPRQSSSSQKAWRKVFAPRKRWDRSSPGSLPTLTFGVAPPRLTIIPLIILPFWLLTSMARESPSSLDIQVSRETNKDEARVITVFEVCIVRYAPLIFAFFNGLFSLSDLKRATVKAQREFRAANQTNTQRMSYQERLPI